MARRLPIKKESDASLAFFFLCIYSIFILIRPHEFSPATEQLIIIKILAIITVVLALFTLRPLNLLPQHYLLFSLIPVILISAILNGWFSGGLSQANIMIVSSTIPFFLFSNCVTSISRQHIIMYICLIAAMFMVYNGHLQSNTFNGAYGVGIGDLRSVSSLARQEIRITYFGFFNDPNDLGMFLVMNLPLACYFFFQGKTIKKLVMLSIISALLYGGFLTGSRGTLLGVIGTLSMYYLITKGGVKIIVFSLIAAPLIATMLASLGGVSGSGESANGRLDAWYVGIEMLMSHPLFGIGMGNFIEEHNLVAHNSYIHIAAELGFIGYSLWGGTLMLSMLASFLLIKKYPTLEGDDISDAKKLSYLNELKINKVLFFSMVGFMITAFFLSRSYSLLLFIFIGLQTASHIRIIRLSPNLKELFSKKVVYKCMWYSWSIILTVFIAMKVGL